MKILIFEGIASSGKTTIEKLLLDQLSKAQIIEETDTLMPIIDNKDVEVAKGHLAKLLTQIKTTDCDFMILDRFHITHTFRTASDVHAFSAIEDSLASLGEVHIVLLTMQNDAIRGRIEETMEYRKDGWNKGGRGAKTIDEKVAYYTGQQKRLRQLVTQSNLPHVELDTTEKDWDRCAQKLLKLIND